MSDLDGLERGMRFQWSGCPLRGSAGVSAEIAAGVNQRRDGQDRHDDETCDVEFLVQDGVIETCAGKTAEPAGLMIS